MRRALAWLCLFGLAPSSCALVGYDFGDYQRAPASAAAGAHNEPQPTHDGGAHNDERTGDNEQASGGLADGPTISGSAGTAEHPIGPEPTTFSAGGAPGETCFASGGAPSDGGAAPDGCDPQTCEELPAACGSRDDGCGHELDCGSCFWWFLECRQNVCEFRE